MSLGAIMDTLHTLRQSFAMHLIQRGETFGIARWL
jgi:site-specific recombinase XerD